jgi:hypothetical protein
MAKYTTSEGTSHSGFLRFFLSQKPYFTGQCISVNYKMPFPFFKIVSTSSHEAEARAIQYPLTGKSTSERCFLDHGIASSQERWSRGHE